MFNFKLSTILFWFKKFSSREFLNKKRDRAFEKHGLFFTASEQTDL